MISHPIILLVVILAVVKKIGPTTLTSIFFYQELINVFFMISDSIKKNIVDAWRWEFFGPRVFQLRLFL